MYLTRVTFGTTDHPTTLDQADLEDLIMSYLISLQRNGQACDNYLYSLCSGHYTAYTNLARPDAMLRRYHSQYGLTDLQRLINAFGREPQWQVLADQRPQTFHDFQTSTFLYLSTSFLDETSPVCCGDTGERLPSYLINLDDDERERLYFWARDYNRTDGLFMSSGELEIPAYTQLASPHSGLSQQGRDRATHIEAATGIPTYYYLTRYYGRSEGEIDRNCPGCNGAWQVEEYLLHPGKFWHFPFRCAKCRLVSRIADAAYEDEWAHIGEFEA